MTEVKARALFGNDKSFEATTIERRKLDENDVLIEIRYAGICHSDIHTGRSEWGQTKYPIVPGHEIAGMVTEIGTKVTKYKVGDRVGVGCMVDSCGKCDNCLNGDQQYCKQGAVMTYASTDKYGTYTQGGYSTHIVVKESFVLRIPESIELSEAAPLLCAGITTYSPFLHWEIKPGSQVAVVGLGGLGHMAVQIASAMGAEVTILSQTLDKEDDGIKLGAKHYYATKDDQTFEKLAGSFDFILNTVSAKLPLDKFLSLLKLNGSMVNVGAPAEPLDINVFSLIGARRSFGGSLIGGIEETQRMLDFCAEHNIAAKVEVIKADEIDAAWERMLKSDVRYRFVIDSTTI